LSDLTNRGGDPLRTADATRLAVEETHDDPKLDLLAEELSVTKETVETGRVRISARTHEREVLIDENLAHESVEIETIPVGRRIDAVPEVRQEGDTTIVSVVEEVLVIERRLMLKEEVRIRRVRTTERHQEKITLRHQEAIVARYQHETDTADAKSVTGLGEAKPETDQRKS
jgi:uncharacterized protein (TIGR02271 family)